MNSEQTLESIAMLSFVRQLDEMRLAKIYGDKAKEMYAEIWRDSRSFLGAATEAASPEAFIKEYWMKIDHVRNILEGRMYYG